MDSDAVHRQDRSSPAPAVRVHSHRVAASQPLELTPSMAFAMIARDADAASGRSTTRTAPRAAAVEVDLAALDLPTGAAPQAGGSLLAELGMPSQQVSPQQVSPQQVSPGPVSELDLRTEPDPWAELGVEADEPGAADADVAPPPPAEVLSPNLAPRRRRRRWWQRLLRRRAHAACSMCYSETLPCPLGHP